MKLLHVALLASLAFAAVPASTARAQATATQEKKAPPVYDEAADARADLAAALARAKKENRRVLVQWGANWCGWCRLLHERMTKDRGLSTKLLYEYDVVRVDVGRFDKNMDLAAELGADFKSTGIPYLTVLDAGGKPLAQQETGVFEAKVDEKDGHDAAKLIEFLAQHQAPYLDATAVRTAAFERAKAEKKRVFLHFGAPW